MTGIMTGMPCRTLTCSSRLHSISYLCKQQSTMARKILAIFLISVVFISTSGIVFATHTCLAGSERTVSFFEEMNCCQEESTPCQAPESSDQHLLAKCCVTEYTYHKTEASAPGVEQESQGVPALFFILPDRMEPSTSGFLF